jgi:hypothetical protein
MWLRSRNGQRNQRAGNDHSAHVNYEVVVAKLGFPGRGGTEDVEQCQNVVEAISCRASG